MISEASQQAHRSRIRAHLERELGTVKNVFQAPSVDVLHVPSSDERPVHTLVTAGMSDAPMNTGGVANVPQYLEVMMTLPRQWKLDGISDQDPAYWPIRTLMNLARFPQQHDTSLKWGDVVPNGEPPVPYASDTKLSAVILAPSLLVPKEFYALDSGDRHVEFYAAIPLYPEELALHREHGMKHVLTLLIDNNINDLVDVKRRNVARKRFGFF
ncbi:MAG: suppressor of fused domain protein [Povalibacter sp.]